MRSDLAYIEGPRTAQLWFKTLGKVLDDQADRFGDRPALIVPWQSACLSYRQLATRSRLVARAMLGLGLCRGDSVGIMAGNRYEYIEVFLAGARIGCPVVVLNNTYTPEELRNAVHTSSCKAVFIASKISSRHLRKSIATLHGESYPNPDLPELRKIVCFENDQFNSNGVEVQPYRDLVGNAASGTIGDEILRSAEALVTPEDVLNLQFTSGTTGAPRAAMLTHINLVNNGRFVGDSLNLTQDDVVCCPPPLFHCFGLVLGFLGSLTHGSAIVFPSDSFDAERVLDAILSEQATIIHGVPTMFVAILEVIVKTGKHPQRLRAGLSAGAALPPSLIESVREKMGFSRVCNAYGMTETSPITFMTALADATKRLNTIGTVMPHSAAKIVDADGRILARGERGEICTSGYALQKGYWRNEAKTREVMKRDENGVLWMLTGDEGMIDEEGCGHITGRIKDVIIRGGENIFPQEIEERLVAHPGISDASVVGLKNERYGEAVASFLKANPDSTKPGNQEVVRFVQETLGRHKAPQHIFWIGDAGVGDSIPKTGSGKHQKHVMREIGHRLLREKHFRAKI